MSYRRLKFCHYKSTSYGDFLPCEIHFLILRKNIATQHDLYYMWVSKVAIVEPTSKKPSRIGYALAKDGTKTRVFKKTGKEIK